MDKIIKNQTGGYKMKKAMRLVLLCVTGLLLMMGVSWSEETAWYDAQENWIMRVYSGPAQQLFNVPSQQGDNSIALQGYSVMLEVVDTGNNLVTDSIVGMATNPLPIVGNAASPDVSLAYDEASATAYVIYTATGGVSLQAVPDIVRAGAVLTATPNPVLYGNVAVGTVKKKMITVTNTGVKALNITSLGTTGDPFKIVVGTTCAVGVPVAVGGSCSIVVKFTPAVPAPYDGSFVLSSDGGNVTVILKGSGI